MASEADNVRVAVRIRPLVPSEQNRGCQEAIERIRDAPQVIVNRTDTFTFNYVFDANDTQEHIYEVLVPDLLGKLLEGFNATILAYGQTGSGKTHTMGTAYGGQLNSESGVIPRAMCDIFERLEKLSNQYDFVVKCSFVELYQEQLYDLLSDQPREQAVVDIRENRNGILMVGLTELNVTSAQETTDCLVRGSAGRAVGATAMNEQSSRSHAIFTLYIQLTKKDEARTVTTSKFHLVDLAGSERSKKTQATGDRFKEGVKINQGLLALGNVISALGSGQGSGFVRYRDSKLTRLLQDSLGGNSVTLMIACVSPADYNVAETLSSLRYADRARKIKNKPIVNQDPHAAEVNNLKSIIQKLRLELLAAGGGATIPMTDSEQVGQRFTQDSINSNAYKSLQAKYHNMQLQFQATLHDLAEAELRAHLAEESNEKLKLKTEEMKLIIEEVAKNLNEAPSDQINNTFERVQQLKTLVEGLKFDPETGFNEHEPLESSNNGVENDTDEKSNRIELLEVQSLMQEQAETFTNTQMDYKAQLRRINRELNLKEELHQRVNGNLIKFCSLDNNIDEKYKECEQKIKELEAEKSDLLDKLKHVNDKASAKLAEERRKRLQSLELELTEMKRKIMQQTKLLKVREKETQKIENLHKEIQAMKESKVKLIRAMRQESENFRQWKLLREKELIQLRSKDRKLKNEMARKEALHTKQRNVLKRKCEEALAINKRLKDALDCQKMAQLQRQKMQLAKDAGSSKTKTEQLISWVERELEVIVSLIDAEHSLEQLMEDRVVINNRIAELQHPEPPIDGSEQFIELKALEEELEMRNAQITDLQQKVCSVNLETRMRTLYESVQSVSEARTILKKLLKSISDMRREHSNRLQEQTDALTEHNLKREASEQSCAAMAKRIRLLELEHEEAIAERENAYEEKITVLLRELHKIPQATDSIELTPEQEECRKIQHEHLNKIDSMREELDYYKNLVADLRQAVEEKAQQSTKSRKKKITTDDNPEQPSGIKMEEDSFTTDMEWDKTASEIDSEDSSDPDWIKTPLIRGRKSRMTVARSKNSSTDTDMTSFASAHSVIEGEVKPKSKEDKFKGCKCAGNCRQKKCGCVRRDMKCTEKCRCDSGCINGKNNPGSKFDEEKDENLNEVNLPASSTSSFAEPENDVDRTFLKPAPAYLTPKMAKLSTLSFDTPSTKQKFFQS